jgi:hypothetical protein
VSGLIPGVFGTMNKACQNFFAVSLPPRAGISCANEAQLQAKDSKENKKVFLSKAILIYLMERSSNQL